jgi:peroxiredoxin
MQCRALVAQLGRHKNDFLDADTYIIPILGERVELAQDYARKLKLPFPVLADAERQVYHRYGLQKAIILIQRSAYFIIDKQGMIQSMKTTINPLVWLDEYDQLFQEVLRINRSYSS